MFIFFSFSSPIFNINIGTKGIKGKTVPKKVQPVSMDNHKVTNELAQVLTKTLKTVGMKVGEQTTIKIIDGAIKSFFNASNEQATLSGMTLVSNLGVNNSTITRTNFHIGRLTTKRVKRQGNTPLVEFFSKVLASSHKDYIQHGKRKNLTLTSGFEQKGYSFLMEDTFLSTRDLLELFSKDQKIKKNLLRNKNSLRDVYGCLYNTRLNLKISSGIDYYSVKVRIHLVRITDIHDDPRELISEITNNINNKFVDVDSEIETNSTETNKTKTNNTKSEKKSTVRNLLRKGSEAFSELSEKTKEEIVDDLINRSNIDKTLKDTFKRSLKGLIRSNGSLRGKKSDLGRLNEDEQYTDPNVNDLRNQFSVNFNTSIRTQLNDSIQFRDRAKILHTWSRVLSPGSIWDFNITQHFGKGIHLNYLYDIENLNDEHPATYVFVIEHFGDARAKVIRKKDNDTFCGYGPSRLRIEFEHRINYLGTQNDEMLDHEDPIPCVYKTKRREEDFEPGSEFAELFTPDREPSFNLNFEDIQMIEDNKKSSQKKDFILQYDTTIMPSENLLEGLKQTYQNRGLDGNDVTEDDLDKNIPEKEYEGTEGENIIDLDE